MKIIKTDIYRFSIPMQPFAIATGVMNYAQNIFIRIHTDEGFYGVGEASAFPMIVGETQDTCILLAQQFGKLWKDKDPLDIPARLEELNAYIARNYTVKSAFDMALHDIASKAANLPLYKFLGGEKRVVETDITIGIDSADAMASLGSQFDQQGASVIKVKLGKNVREDLQRIQAIKKAVRPGIRLRIDANQGWSFHDAVWILDAMADLDIEFCEQPLRSWDDDLLPELCSRSAIKIMADESCYNHHDARRLLAAGACHYLNIKLAKSGGIYEATEINQEAARSSVACMIGGMLESRLALSANLHFAYASSQVQFYDMDTCLIGHLADPVTGGVRFKGFFLDISDAPGIGADVDDLFLKTCQLTTV